MPSVMLTPWKGKIDSIIHHLKEQKTAVETIDGTIGPSRQVSLLLCMKLAAFTERKLC